MRTELSSLEMLLAVAEHGSIGAAARKLGVTQPSATERLHRLERHLRLQLLERSPRGTRLTTEGTTVADWARDVLDASTRLEDGVAALRERRDGMLRVSASMTISEYLVPRWLAELRVRASDTNVALRVRNSHDVAVDVLGGDADLGFVEGLTVPDGLRARLIGRDELVVVVAPGHPWSRRHRAVGAADLAHARLVLREHGSGTREALDHALGLAGYQVTASLELGSTAAIKAAVMGEQGAGVLSRLAAEDDTAAGRLRTVPVDDVALQRKLRCVWRSGTRLTGPAAELARVAARSASSSRVPDSQPRKHDR